MSVKQIKQQVEEISQNENLQKDLQIVRCIPILIKLTDLAIQLPKNYTFEVPKTIWKIRATSSKTGRPRHGKDEN